MTLLQVRTKAAQLSGRYDLVNPSTFADNGMDFFIQAGQDRLDRMINHRKATNRIFDGLAAGLWYKTFQRCRAIQGVWINDTESRWELEKKELGWLRWYYSKLISATDRAKPAYYAPAKLRSTELTDKDSLGAFFNYVAASTEDYHGIVIFPPPDTGVVVEIEGLFYADALTVDASTSFWTINHPMILVWAALYMLEVSYRNTEGAKDWMASIQAELTDLDKDGIEEEIATVDEMEG